MLTLIDVIAVSFDIQMVLSKPDFGAMAPGWFLGVTIAALSAFLLWQTFAGSGF